MNDGEIEQYRGESAYLDNIQSDYKLMLYQFTWLKDPVVNWM